MLSARNITRAIDGRKILDKVSLSVERGEILCIVGPSGAGKTSLLRTLSLIDTAEQGFVELDGKRYDLPLAQNVPLPYPEITVVFQQFFIWPHLTVRENILLPVQRREVKRKFDEIIRLLQMEDFLDRYPNEISGGQKQRAALARALILEPKYLLLDEVTSALDVEQAHLILKHLKEIARRGVGIVLVTHALHLSRKISDKVLFLDGGRVVEEGPSEILMKPKTQRLRTFLNALEAVV